MGNRPINRNPFRRKPWRRKVRPTRWNAHTLASTEGGTAQNTTVPINLGLGNPPIAVLVSGQTDVEPWADDQEVTLDRVVGSMCFYGYSYYSVLDPPPSRARNVILKVGLVLNEEVGQEPLTPTIDVNLWEQEQLEDREWIWLHTAVLPLNYQPVIGNDLFAGIQYTVPVDIRNRRKIGQSDELTLYASFACDASGYDVSLMYGGDLRTILMSR